MASQQLDATPDRRPSSGSAPVQPLLRDARRRRRRLRPGRVLRPVPAVLAVPDRGTRRVRAATPRHRRRPVDRARPARRADGHRVRAGARGDAARRQAEVARRLWLCEVRDGRITEVVGYCNGGWDDELRARHAAEAPMCGHERGMTPSTRPTAPSGARPSGRRAVDRRAAAEIEAARRVPPTPQRPDRRRLLPPAAPRSHGGRGRPVERCA